MEQIAKAINQFGMFCGKRDVEKLITEHLQETYGIKRADVMVLFGGSILAGGDVLADAMKNQIAEKYVIVGGAGHTTETLRQCVREEHPELDVDGKPEAEVFQKYLNAVYNCHADYLEIKSTNCGNNITYFLELLKKNFISFESIILCQDATMQNRMDAGLRKCVSDEVTVINYASYRAEVITDGSTLSYKDNIHGMWRMERYINLLMGEIQRLTDDENGYGPKGKDYIAHVDIPGEVETAFAHLKTVYGNQIREANPLYASVKGNGVALT